MSVCALKTVSTFAGEDHSHMKNNESFIENRIRWRANQYGLPKKNTYFWKESRNKPDINLPNDIGNPVLVSESDGLGFIILCTFGAVVSHNGFITSFKYQEIDEVRDSKINPDEKKEDLSRLVVWLKNGNELQVPAETGSPAFGVWNILLMLMRMS